MIQFTPRWREELVATSNEGKLIFELTMGTYHVYFPDLVTWKKSVPDWAKDQWEYYEQDVQIGVNNSIFRFQL